MFETPMSNHILDKLKFDELPEEVINKYENPTEVQLINNAIDMADGVIVRTNKIPEAIAQHLEEKDIDVVDFSGIDLEEDEAELKKRFLEAFSDNKS